MFPYRRILMMFSFCYDSFIYMMTTIVRIYHSKAEKATISLAQHKKQQQQYTSPEVIVAIAIIYRYVSYKNSNVY